MKKAGLWVVVVVIALLILTAVGVHRWFNPPAPAAQLFFNGTVLTMDPQQPVADAMLVKHGEIVALGEAEVLRQQVSRDVMVIDLEGGTLMPGFIEAHGYFPGEGLSAVAVDANSPPIGDLHSIDTLLERLGLLAQRRSEGGLLAYGFDHTAIGEQRYPTRSELDSVSETRPIVVMHRSGHFGVVNSAALSSMGIKEDVTDPTGGFYGRDETGRLNGLLAEAAFYPVRSKALALASMDLLKVLSRASHIYLSRGITFAQNGLADPAAIRALEPALQFGLIPLRLSLWPNTEAEQQRQSGKLDIPEGDRIHLGPVKLVSEGSLQGYSGFFGSPYYSLPDDSPEDDLGGGALSQQALNDQVQQFHCQGRQVAVHANGHASIDQSLNAIAGARSACPQVRVRPVLIHVQMATPEQLQRMVVLDVIPSFFNVDMSYWGDRHQDIFPGQEPARQVSPLAQAAQAGLRFTLHADSPMVPFEPLQLVWNAVERKTASGALLGPAQAVGVERALQAVTVDAAKQLGVADQVGQLRPGMRADLVWMDRDPREAIGDWREIQVLGTWVGGVRRYPSGQAERPRSAM